MQIFDYFSLTPSTITEKVFGLHKKLDIQNHGLLMGFQKNIGFFRKKFKIFFSGPKTIFENCKIAVFGPFSCEEVVVLPNLGYF